MQEILNSKIAAVTMSPPQAPAFSTILAFDCAGAAVSAALCHQGIVAASRFQTMDRGHAETLLPQIAAVMTESGTAFADLDLIVTTVGPGSFTGLRIGLAAARGLAFAAQKPIIGVDCFEAILAGAADTPETDDFESILTILDSKRGPVFARRFSRDHHPLCPPYSQEIPDLIAWASQLSAPIRVIGDGIRCLLGLDLPDQIRLSPAPTHLDARIIGQFASHFTSQSLNRLAIEPLYLRAPDVTAPRNRTHFAAPDAPIDGGIAP